MEIFSPLVGTLEDALAGLRRGSFPGMSSEEADAFSLGFWAGAMALAIGTTEETITADELAERVETELKRIEEGKHPA